ncbi:hypothetical protein GWI33_022962, partial [Rhynchophorus ferrugineus]
DRLNRRITVDIFNTVHETKTACVPLKVTLTGHPTFCSRPSSSNKTYTQTQTGDVPFERRFAYLREKKKAGQRQLRAIISAPSSIRCSDFAGCAAAAAGNLPEVRRSLERETVPETWRIPLPTTILIKNRLARKKTGRSLGRKS